MADWPANLPAPLLDSFREAVAETVIRTSMDAGPAKARRRSSAGSGSLTLNYIVSRAQAAVLDSFFDGDAAGGALPFGFTHPRTGATLSCRFRQPPAYAALNGPYFRVSIELEVLP